MTLTRKLMRCIGRIASAGRVLATRDVHSPTFARKPLCGVTGSLGLTWSGHAPTGVDLAPQYAALLFGFSNTIATIRAVTVWR
jgi:hypothetical protein